MDKFYQPNSGLGSSRSLHEAIYTYKVYIYIYMRKPPSSRGYGDIEGSGKLYIQREYSTYFNRVSRESENLHPR